ncbi:Glutamate synthase [NADPH] large chain [Enhygromyxa salina]|uniref:Glutamate synthase [NADPH] large chain n=1 Tax=Enhygromyxa salina TaxID=215803 RepID=A0A2S9Y4J7_9BACT|nr:glutamate synthase-related protein [Enhygromyxa salina]PRQ00024.1 Glutamate synthase [NADPH] large chain [Enhygromyxa salina]
MPDRPPIPSAAEPVVVASWSELGDRQPAHALVADVDLVIVRFDERVSVLYGRCLHRGALLSDGHVDGPNLICGVHDWDYRLDTGVSAYNNAEALHKFGAWIDQDADTVVVDRLEIAAWAEDHPQPFDRAAYQGSYADTHPVAAEPFNKRIRSLARDGLSKTGHHGPSSAMGVPLTELPRWSSIQIVTAQLARQPRLDDEPVGTELVIGPTAAKPLRLEIPLFVSDMSFGALSEEAKLALARGAELAGTGICSGEGGMLPEEQQANSRYFYELASGRFGWSLDKVARCQAFHFKGGQGAKTGTGGHLPGSKVSGKIAEVRNLSEGEPAISPATFPDLHTVADFRRVADEVREVSGGIPIGFKLSAQHIEADIDFALEIGCEYLILDGRGGGTGAAPELFKANISVPTIPALARARRHLDHRRGERGGGEVTLIITGGLRTEGDFCKALALGADAIAVSNAALQAIGCLGMRACHTNNCPVGIATQKPQLRARLEIEQSARQLHRYFSSTVELMKIMARACGHEHLREFSIDDLTTWDRDMAYLSGVAYGGVVPL